MRYQTISRAALIFVMAVFVLTGCGGLRRMTALKALRNGIANQFQSDDVRVSLQSDQELLIVITHARYEHAPNEIRSAEAQKVAVFVRDHYGDIKNVSAIRVILAIKTDPTKFYDEVAYLGSYVFDRDAKPSSTTARGNPSPSRDLLLYGEQANDGTVRDGMTLFPSFSARTAKTPIPPTVGLDLAAFSNGPLFKNDHRFVLTAEGQTLAEGSATYQSTGTIADGQTAEFMTITIAYAKFKQLAHSRDASLIIGPKEIAFTDSQRSVFKKMVADVETSGGSGGGTR